MIDFNKYKTQINLVDYLVRIKGWKIEEKGRSPKLICPDSGDKFIFKMNKLNQYTYWDLHNPDNCKGKTIFDVILREHELKGQKTSFSAIANSLERFMLSGEYIEPDKCKFDIAGSLSNQQIASAINSCIPLNDLSYLTGRGLSESIILDNIFKDVVKEKIVFDKETRISSKAIAFIISDGENNIGLSLKSETIHGRCIGHKENGLVCSNVKFKNQPLSLFLVEGFIDAMSHYQLNFRAIENKNIFYGSTEGSLTLDQISFVQKIIEKSTMGVIEVNLGFDNDIFGKMNSALALTKLEFPNSNKIFKQIKPFVSKESIDFILPIDSNFSERFNILKDSFSNDSFKTETSNVNNTFRYSITAPISLDKWDLFNNLLNTIYHGKDSQINIIVPISKDFNKDLTSELNKTIIPQVVQNKNGFSI